MSDGCVFSWGTFRVLSVDFGRFVVAAAWRELLRAFVSGWSCESGSWRGWPVHPRSCAGGFSGCSRGVFVGALGWDGGGRGGLMLVAATVLNIFDSASLLVSSCRDSHLSSLGCLRVCPRCTLEVSLVWLWGYVGRFRWGLHLLRHKEVVFYSEGPCRVAAVVDFGGQWGDSFGCVCTFNGLFYRF